MGSPRRAEGGTGRELTGIHNRTIKITHDIRINRTNHIRIKKGILHTDEIGQAEKQHLKDYMWSLG